MSKNITVQLAEIDDKETRAIRLVQGSLMEIDSTDQKIRILNYVKAKLKNLSLENE